MKKPSISICVPTYKRLDFLYKLLDSIPNDVPVCLSDNGSFITTELDAYRNVVIEHQKDVVNMFANWNRAVDMTDTDWFIIPGDDDLYDKGTFDELYPYLEKYNGYGMIIFGHEYIDENDNVKGSWMPKEEKAIRNPDGIKEFIPTIHARVPSIVFNTRLVKEIGMFNDKFSFTAADSMLIQQMSLRAPIALIPRILGKYRIWASNFTNQKCFSTEWFDQLYLWMAIISEDIKGYKLNINTEKMKSLIIGENIIHGLIVMNNNNKTISEKLRFFLMARRHCHLSIYQFVSMMKLVFS